ncbi:MAG: radical SAM protein [Candidatus Latescibacteria bacterium]|nr:radical SAM protein [Candidatus Latescibacterota bacterium]NIM22391.1 radical SAM protein [Candidatus Latescibacterota bacterium]NIM64751.1 radical SAM protein [Candidatus Latescibacterota bacterium]NIO01262.1 radical SAM protein [Candidatus Latescibacterota bacterium]NIO27754.1 radical SAM protein [Candidatus Latescibacterota bacterium]
MSLSRVIFNGTNHILFYAPKALRKSFLKLISYFPFDVVYPSVFMIEPTNICNGLCPLCPIGVDSDDRKKGYLQYETFIRLVDEIKDIAKLIIMNFAGDPILHPRIGDLIAYAENNGIQTIIGTNGTIDKAEELIRAGASEILFSLDGASEETYHKYRNYKDDKGFEEIVENLRKLVVKKSEIGNGKTNIVLQFVVFKHNEHEIDDIVKLGDNIGVDAVDLKPVCLNDFFDDSLDELIKKYLPKDQNHYIRRRNKFILKKPPLCSFVFHETEILWNGDVTICCYDYDGGYVIGNISDEGGFKKIWKSKKYREMRRKIVNSELELCRKCANTSVFGTRLRLKEM